MTPPDPEVATSPDEASRGGAGLTGMRVRLGLWVVLVAGFIGFLLIGSVSAISYQYSVYTRKVTRLDVNRSLIDIWRDQVSDLPAFSVGWLPGVVFVLSIAIVTLCAVGGAWLLLMSPDAAAAGRPRRAAGD
jgi:hypothetical protein